MKLTKYEQETIILYNQAEDTASIYTHDADLKRRLTKYSKQHPTGKGCCQGYYDLYLGQSKTVYPSAFSFQRGTQRASEFAKQHGFQSNQTDQ